MKLRIARAFFSVVALAGVSALARSDDLPGSRAPLATVTGRHSDGGSALGLRFEANVGQADPSVRFIARYGRATALLTSDAIVLLPPGGPPLPRHPDRRALAEGKVEPWRPSPSMRADVIRLRDADPRAALVGEDPLSATITSFHGPGAHGLAVPSFERVRTRSAYPGIDVVFHAGPRGIEIDFEVSPSADPSRIAFEHVGGEQAFEVQGDGSLASKGGARPIVLSPPRTFELAAGTRSPIASAWRSDATFAVGARSPQSAIVIDPVLDMATYLGGSGDDVTGIGGVALDGAGNIYVAGTTTSSDLPVSAGAYDTTLAGADDVFVAKTSADGKTLLYCTYLGGSGIETYAYLERPIVVDAGGAVFVSGQTASSDFPTTPGAYDTTPNGGYDAYVTKLAPDGKSLLYSTVVGGTGDDHGFGIAVDAAGAAYLGGWTKSLDFPITSGSIASSATDFVLKLAPNGGSLVYSTHAGGPTMVIFALAAQNGIATVTGDTRNDAFPITPGAFQPTYGGGLFDVAVMQLNAAGTDYRYSTYLGGDQLDESFAIALDGAGNAVVVGDTYSANFPTSTNAFQKSFGGDKDAWIAKLDAKGQKLLYGSFIGSTEYDGATGVCVDPLGNAFISGLTMGALPAKSSCTPSGLGYIQMLEPSGNVRFSTLVPDQVFAVACGPSRVVGFMSAVADDRATPGAYDTTTNGGTDLVLFGLRAGPGPAGVECKPCDGAFDGGTSRACDDPARPLCNAGGPLSGACTECNAADATRCPNGKVCDLLTGVCTDPPPDGGVLDGGAEAGEAGPADAAGLDEAGSDTGRAPRDRDEDEEPSCSCRTAGAGGATPVALLFVVASALGLARFRGKRAR